MQVLTFITLSNNSESSRELKDALGASGRVRLLADCDTRDQMLADVIRLRPAAAVVLLGAETSEKEFALIKQLAAACPDTAIIAAARDASPAMVMGSLRSGAREFLQVPVIAEEFHTVLDRVAELRAAGEDSRKTGRIVAVFSGKGGAGVSFFATNLAAAMNAQTLLVDLNLQTGDAASFLGLEPKYSFADFVLKRARLDNSLISSLITPHSPRLALLAAPLEPHEAEDISTSDVTQVLHLLSQNYDCVVLDLQHTFDPMTIAALDLADDVLLVMTMDIPGIRNTKRALKVFKRLGYPRDKIRVVVNRWSKNIDVELHKVETHLDEQLVGFVPNDYRKVMDSINLGRPLVQSDPSSKITVEIKRIAGLVDGSNQSTSSQPRKKLLGSMFGRSNSTALELSAVQDSA